MAWPITRADVIKALNYPVGASDNDELDLFAQAAVERVEEEVGPMSGQSFTLTARGPAKTIRLKYVLPTVTQVTVDGVATSNYTLDADAGLITGDFVGNVIVVTAVAPTTAPAYVFLATRELAAIWYTQDHSRGGGKNSAGGGTFVPLGFAIPREVAEKLAPAMAKKLPGIG